MKIRADLAAFVAILIVVGCVYGQTNPNPIDIGLQGYHDFHDGDIDHVNLDNGNLTFAIPLVSYPQRGGALKTDFAVVYNGTGREYSETCDPNLGCMWWWGVSPVAYSEMSLTPTGASASPALYDTQRVASGYTRLTLNTTPVTYWDQLSWYSADGGSHLGGQTSNGQIALDGSGFQANYTETPGTGGGTDTCTWTCSLPAVVPSPYLIGTHSGITFVGSGTGSDTARIDADGNYITSSYTSIIDSVGRVIAVPTVNSSPTTAQKAMCANPGSDTAIAYWTPPGYSVPSGYQGAFTFCYETVTLSVGEVEYNGNIITAHPTQTMLESIALPNGQTWAFQYTGGITSCSGASGVNLTTNAGDLTQITFPTGGSIQYSYTCIEPGYSPSGLVLTTAVTSRTVNDGTGSYTWNYSYSSDVAGSTTMTDAALNDTVDTFSSSSRTIQQYSGTGGSRTLMRTTTLTYPSQYATVQGFPMYPTNRTVTLENGQESQTTFGYCCDISFSNNIGSTIYWPQAASYGKVTDSKIYDYASSGLGILLKETKTAYLFQSNVNYLNPGFFDLASSQTILSGAGINGTTGGNYTSGSQIGKTSNIFDQAAFVGVNSGIAGLSGAQMTAPIFSGVYGHLTTQDNWLNTGGSDPITTTSFYDFGAPYQVTDPMLNVSSTYYCTSSPQTTLPCTQSTYLGALPTVVSNALGQQTSFTYFTNTGLKHTVKDPNQQTATYAYNDPLNRVTSISYPDLGSTSFSYNDSTIPYGVTVNEAITGATGNPANLNKVTQANVDGLGRLYETELTSDPSGTTYTYRTYDAMGRKSKVWNPSRCALSPTVTSCTIGGATEHTFGITTYQYDALSRETLLIPPDGTASTDNEATSYAGNTTTVTDEAGNYRVSTVDALGRLSQVTEGAPGYVTLYVYDPLGNLTCVEQHGTYTGQTGCLSSPTNDGTSQWHIRRFTYDSLSRLLDAQNPETGTVTYTYNADGFMKTKKDARAITTTYTPDALNRVTQKAYSDSTPTVTYSYDAFTSGSNYGVGHRTGMTDGSGSATWTYDTMGRVWKESKAIGTINVTPVNNTYNLDGSLASMTYPGGSVFNFTMGGDGRPTQLINPTHSVNYIENAVYASTGQLTSALFGTSSTYLGITEADSFNSRGQPITLSACGQSSCSGSSYLFNLGYTWGLGTNDNGNVQAIANRRNSGRDQNFSYDSLNRITEATSSSWGLTFTIDAWANLYSTSIVSGLANPMPLNQTMTTTGHVNINRFQSGGYGYDAAGNVLNDGITENSCTGGNGYAWDAEERIICAGGATYTYDGDGVRVEKNGGSATPTLYFSDNVETDLSGNETSVYVFFNGRRIARRDPSSGYVYYFFQDLLGSSNVVAAQAPAPPNYGIENESDFYPYGGEKIITAGLTNQVFKFEGKERDTETGLDNFGARYYGSITGRFESPDWANQAEPVPYAKLGNPQSLNLYAFVGNNPESTPDLDGHEAMSLQQYRASLWAGSGSDPSMIPGDADFSVAPPDAYFSTGLHIQIGDVGCLACDGQAPAAQQNANRQPDGSYKATPAKIAEIRRRDKHQNDKNGNPIMITSPTDPLGQCVTACEHFTGVPGPTSSWRGGRYASELTNDDIGLAIATIGPGPDGRYEGAHKNSGVFMGTARGGILIADQWPQGKATSIWLMPFHDPRPNYSDNASMNAASYRVIIVNP